MLRKRTSSFTRPANKQEQQMMDLLPSGHPQEHLFETTNSTSYQSRQHNTKPIGSLHINHITSSFQIEENSLKKESRVGEVMRNGLKSFLSPARTPKKCEMCDEDMSQSLQKGVYMCSCDHRNDYCESCLLQYVIYHIKNSQEVVCPKQGCTTLLDTGTHFFKNLPIDIQNNYKTLRAFMMKSKEQGIKLCPRQNCNGILRPYRQILLCYHCQTPFCQRCLQLQHQGTCQKFQVQFFQSSIKYQQCKRCRGMVAKREGSNLLRCKCGGMHCYVCGRPWGPSHEGSHNQYGQIIPSSYDRQIQIIDGGCQVNSSLKATLKVLFLLVFAPLLFAFYVLKDILVFLGLFLVSLFAGLFGFSIELLFRVDCLLRVVGVLFFPITMIIGVGVAFRQVFCKLYPETDKGFGGSFCQKLQSIWLI